MRFANLSNAFGVLALVGGTMAIEVDLTSEDSIKSAAKTLAYDMMSFYSGNESGQIPGLLPYPPYYWWEGGAMWGSLIDYWYYTGDDTYNDEVTQALLFQVGDNWDYMPANQSADMGNDDQGFWAMAAMSAAEYNFPDPPSDGPQWLALAQAVFNEYIERIDYSVCGGGLRWQVYQFNSGWPYKNSISNGCLFNLGARLARYTGNDTYAQWADYAWDWITSIDMIEDQAYGSGGRYFVTGGTGAGGYVVWDGASTDNNCSIINGIPYSYNAGIWLMGAAVMYNYTNGDQVWADRVSLLLNGTLNVFFPNGIAYEYYCEAKLNCKTDMFSFKAFLTRWMAVTTQLAPFTLDPIMSALSTSAAAAAAQCCGGDNGRMCGLSWYKEGTWDGTSGVGQQMAALEVILSNLIQKSTQPVTSSSGGTSQGDPNAGASSTASENPDTLKPVSNSDRAGAGILTALTLIVACSTFTWMSLKEGWWSEKTGALIEKASSPW